MRAELIIAEKEFIDQLYSKRFLVILAILLLLAAYAVATGIDQYNKSLDSYKSQKANGSSNFQDAVNFQQQAIDNAISSGATAEQIESMKSDLATLKQNRDYFLNPSMPSLLQVFQAFTVLFGFMGMVLGIAMGFDQLTKEKESGALKSVLSAPVYRDTLINGKSIGSLAALAVAIGITFLVTIAVMLFYGVVPGLEDLARIFLFFIAAVLYCATFFAIATLTSTVSRNSAMAVILAVGIVFAYIIVAFGSFVISSSVADLIVGPAPAYQPQAMDNGTNASAPYYDPANDHYIKRSLLQLQIQDALNIVSPLYDFTGMGSMYPGIAGALLTKDKPTEYGFYSGVNYDPYSRPEQATLLDSLSYIWVKVLALVVETFAAFGISYMVFMRMDIR